MDSVNFAKRIIKLEAQSKIKKMKFGHAASEELKSLTFSLPADHETSITKQDHSPSDSFALLIGCGKWGIPQWVGPIYPEGTKEKDFLKHYISRFNSIELNGTFYRLSRSSIDKWAEEAKGTAFKYCPKWSRRITHLKRLNDVDENIQYFMDSVAILGDNLGCSFLTLPHNFGPKNIDRVHDFLSKIPDQYPIAIEFRHKEWFEEPLFSETMEILKKKGIAAIITDVALRRDALHMCVTSPTTFVRFNGYGLHQSDYERLDEWIPRIESWKNNGVQNIYFFMHQEDEAHTPVLVDYFAKKLNEKMGLDLPVLNISS